MSRQFIGGTCTRDYVTSRRVSFTVQGPTADLIDPAAGAIAAGTLNGRGYVDVTFNPGREDDRRRPPSSTAEASSRSSGSHGTLAVDPIRPRPARRTNTWRYWTTGTIATGTPIATRPQRLRVH